MVNTTPAAPRDEHDGDGAFGWLPRDQQIAADLAKHTDDDSEHNGDPVVIQSPPEPRIDPLTVNTLINRGLMVALCIIVVAVTFEALRTQSVGVQVPIEKLTNVAPSARLRQPRTTPTTAPVSVTAPAATTPAPTIPATTPATTRRISQPVVTAPPATFPPPTVHQSAPPQTAPSQPIAVPVTTPPATAPPDTVVVPVAPTP